LELAKRHKATVVSAGAVIVGKATGLIVIVLDLLIVLRMPVNIHDSIIVPPHT
jgi:hypothetical protein